MSFGRKLKLKRSQYLVMVFAVIFSHSAMSGAWVPKVGSGYSKLAGAYYTADDFFGEDSASLKFSGRNLSYYGEYGFAENFAIYGTLLYQNIEQTDNLGAITKSNGLGDTELGVRYQWRAKPFVLSTSFLVKLPYLYDKKDELPRGSGREDYEFRVLIGRSLNQYGYLGLEAAYRFRSGIAANEYRYLFEYGFSANKNLYLRTKLDVSLSAEDAGSMGDMNGNLSNSSAFDLTKIELTAGWTFDRRQSSRNKWGMEVTYRRDLSGDNALKGHSVEFGITKVF